MNYIQDMNRCTGPTAEDAELARKLRDERYATWEAAHPPLTKAEAEEFFGILYFGKHHIPSDVKPFGRGWKINDFGGALSTFDFDGLTRLVFLCHDKCVRAQIMQGGPGRVGVAIWKRHGRVGDMTERHPTIEHALNGWRLKHPAPQDEGSQVISGDQHGRNDSTK
jgi:hypothetical protein